MSKIESIIEYITQEIVILLVKEKKIEYDQAMNLFYSSKIYEKLIDSETGLYLESTPYIYDLFKEELKNGLVVQAEI